MLRERVKRKHLYCSTGEEETLSELKFCTQQVVKLYFKKLVLIMGTSQGALMVKNLPAMQETRVRLLSQEYPLEEDMATHSSILIWRIPWTEEPGGLQSMGSQRVGHD